MMASWGQGPRPHRHLVATYNEERSGDGSVRLRDKRAMAHLLVVPGTEGDGLGGVIRSRESTTGHTWMEELGTGSRASVTTLAKEACLGR